MNRRYGLVAQRAAHRCEYCRAPEAVFNFPFEVAVVVARRRTILLSSEFAAHGALVLPGSRAHFNPGWRPSFTAFQNSSLAAS